MDIKKLKIDVTRNVYSRVEGGLYEKTPKIEHIEYDDTEILALVRQDYIYRQGLEENESLEFSIDSIELY